MQLKPLAVAAGLLAAPAVNAFLLPPEISESDVHIAETLETVTPPSARAQALSVECPGCPILVKARHGRLAQVKTDRPSHLQLKFDVDVSSGSDKLMVNGFELYPTANPFANVLAAPQTLDDLTEEIIRDKHLQNHLPLPQRLGFALGTDQGKSDVEGHFKLVTLDLQIIEVGTVFVDGIPSVKVQLIKDRDGRLAIGKIETAAARKLIEGPKIGDERCQTLMCKWMALAQANLNKMRPVGKPHCHHGMKGGMHGGAMGSSSAEHSHPRPTEEQRPGHWHAPQEHSWGQLFKNIASHILLPVLIGIVAGVSVSLIGMAVGTLIVSLWRMFFRRRSRRHSRSHRRASLKGARLAEEKRALMDAETQDETVDVRPPPAYRDEE